MLFVTSNDDGRQQTTELGRLWLRNAESILDVLSEMSAVPGTTSRTVSKEPSEEYRSPYIDYMKLVGTPAEFKLVVGMSRFRMARSHSIPPRHIW